jgi:hypothetical protein
MYIRHIPKQKIDLSIKGVVSGESSRQTLLGNPLLGGLYFGIITEFCWSFPLTFPQPHP